MEYWGSWLVTAGAIILRHVVPGDLHQQHTCIEIAGQYHIAAATEHDDGQIADPRVGQAETRSDSLRIWTARRARASNPNVLWVRRG